MVAKRLPYQSLQPVAAIGAQRNAARNRKADSSMLQTIGMSMYRKYFVLKTPPSADNLLKLTPLSQVVGPGKPKIGTGCTQALRRARPFDRRALRILRPALVLMRARKPCTRLRFSLLG